MIIKTQTFTFSLFSKKVRMFAHDKIGVVIEKEPHVICIYGTDAEHQNIVCAVPLGHPKQLKGMEFRVNFHENWVASIEAGQIRVVVDFKKKTCSNNIGLKNYGSNYWGEDVTVDWTDSLNSLF